MNVFAMRPAVSSECSTHPVGDRVAEHDTAAELVQLARAYLAGEDGYETHQAVDRLAHPALDPARAWAAFEDLRGAVSAGRRDLIDAAVRGLLHPRSSR